MEILRILTYLSSAVFVVVFAIKIIKYLAMPMHVRWELYPIPHEGKPYGGSFFEDVDHWKETRHKDHLAQYRFMIPEILFIRALHEENRPLWYWSFPFHFGLYCALAGLVFLAIGALLQIGGYAPASSALAALVQAATMILAFVGFVLGAIGGVGLFVKRVTDPALVDQSAPIDYFNLVWLALIFISGFFVGLADLGFNRSREFLVGLISLKELPQLSALQIVNLLLFIGFWAYFPFTHMTHMVSKYFMWDKVKWDDDPNVGDPGIDAKIKKYLAYPVTWSAAHVGAEGGKKSWADIATTNPWAKPEKE